MWHPTLYLFVPTSPPTESPLPTPKRQDILHGEETGLRSVVNTGGRTSLELHDFFFSLPVIIILLETNYKSSFCVLECKVTYRQAKVMLPVFSILVDHFRLDKINIPDTPSLFPVTLPASNSC